MNAHRCLLGETGRRVGLVRTTRGASIGGRVGRGALLGCLLLSSAGCSQYVGQYVKDPTGGRLFSYMDGVAEDRLLPLAVDQGGLLAFRIETAHAQLSTDPGQIAMVERVRDHITRALRETEYASAAQQYDWQIVIVKDDKLVHAAAFPGGKIIVWSGLLKEPTKGGLTVPVEKRLAVALGHEVVHVLERHFTQRIDKEVRTALELSMTGKGLSEQGMDPATTAALMAAMGVSYEGAVVRPFTAEQELEADRLGLMLTARAGYDPQSAVDFWTQINTLTGGKQEMEILTMHPSYETRISQLNDWMAEAREHFQPAQASQPQPHRGNAG